MNLMEEGWEAPFFKKLANNDTASASGHQAGVVIPLDLRGYFPEFPSSTTMLSPTQEVFLDALLYNEGNFVERVRTRYQEQSWGGKRSPETRLTENLQGIRKIAQGGDFLVFQRSIANELLYRLILVRASSDSGKVFQAKLGEARWGTVYGSLPMRSDEITKEVRLLDERTGNPFQCEDSDAIKVEFTRTSVARDRAFSSRVLEAYGMKCAVTRQGVTNLNGQFDLEAAHIIPRSRLGPDDVRNGLALSRSMHWAFDQGLWGIVERKVYVSNKVLADPRNSSLKSIRGELIAEAKSPELQAAPEAIEWHFENVVIKD